MRPQSKTTTKINIHSHTFIGLIFMSSGILLTELSYLILHNIPFTAIGISLIILGVTILLLPDNTMAPHSIQMITVESCRNIEALLEQFNANERCFYLPPKDGKVYSYVSLNKKARFSDAWDAMNLPIRLMNELNNKPGLTIFLPLPFDLLKSLNKDSTIEANLNSILVEQLNLVKSVKVLTKDEKISLQIQGMKATAELPYMKKVFGSFSIVISGSTLAYLLNKPLVLTSESERDEVINSIFEVPDKNG